MNRRDEIFERQIRGDMPEYKRNHINFAAIQPNPIVQIEVNGKLLDAKQCTGCKEVKPLTDYSLLTRSEKRKPQCKQCFTVKSRERYEQRKADEARNASEGGDGM